MYNLLIFDHNIITNLLISYLYELIFPDFLYIICLVSLTPRPVKIFIGLHLNNDFVSFEIVSRFKPKTIKEVLFRNFIKRKNVYKYSLCEYPNWGVIVCL